MIAPVPAEWSPHRAMWLGFPSHAELWEDNLAPAQAETAALARALAGPGKERVRLLVRGDAAEAAARALLDDVAGVELVRGLFGDVWLRDTGPIFLDRDGAFTAQAFRFNGWGGKYRLEGDEIVGEQIAAAAGAPLLTAACVMEGGALDHDGLGTVLTTRQCLLNPNRNHDWSEVEAEAALSANLGARSVLWLGDGLTNDHTDGHVDNLARFVAPGVVACPVAWGQSDPNAEVYDDAARRLAGMRTARGSALTVTRIASPGRIEDEEGTVLPASHMNFIIANGAVVAPVYETRAAAFALDTLQSLFPERTVIGLPSHALLSGGGSFHCISREEPA
ncbi:MAG TPA: agmatine deiminase family protein [Caulobacteraceae bacterium]|jgi:agmatine deiminase|nr:agmatine deiminase family protein [Caulobacteraceae bacterium]